MALCPCDECRLRESGSGMLRRMFGYATHDGRGQRKLLNRELNYVYSSQKIVFMTFRSRKIKIGGKFNTHCRAINCIHNFCR
jgi:hypothetical protein